MTHVELSVNSDGRGVIKVDGVDWSNVVRGIDFSSEVGDTTQATVHLAAPDLSADVDVELRLPPAVQEVLVQLGWTPPKKPEPLTASS